MSADMSIVGLFLNASILVQAVMLMLVLASVISWAFIIQRYQVFKRSKKRLQEFEERFWSGTDKKTLYDALNARRQNLTGLEHIFHAGFQEFKRVEDQAKNGQDVSPDSMIEGAMRAMRVALSREEDRLNTHLSFLATVGSTSPYVGLFGTVWGIMQSFIALGAVQQATLAMVAPGISEALIATAMGLFAAIPAVIAYNRYSHNAVWLANQYDNFVEEVSNLFRREAYTNVN